jgi:hypothetical protein
MCLKKVIKKILLSPSNCNSRYQSHKISKLTEDEIKKIIENVSKTDKRFLDLKIKKIGENCYHVYKKK